MTEKKIVAAVTLGCKVNFYDTEAMLKLFADKGYIIGEFETYADIYIINTCSVTNLGDRKSRQMIRRAKKNNPDAIIVAAGCYSQVAPEEVSRIEGVSIIAGTGERSRITELVEGYIEEHGVLNAVTDIDQLDIYEPLGVENISDRTRAYLKIQDGCDNFCAYCIIPYARGRVRSRRPDDVILEVEKFAENGYKEIVLTGIHVASYGKDLSNINLVSLVKMVHNISGIERIRFSSIDPDAINNNFFDMFANYGKICNHFHLSLQSGCDKTLRRMDRKYDTDKYRQAVEGIRRISPEAAVTTDIITGFPGETDEDFLESMEFCESMRLAKLHVFPYSAKKGTKAANFIDQIAPGVIKTRTDKMLELGNRLNEAYLKEFINKEVKVLFEKQAGENYYEGHTTNYALVRAADENKNLSNKIMTVKIKKFENGMLFA